MLHFFLNKKNDAIRRACINDFPTIILEMHKRERYIRIFIPQMKF